ncbi:MAG: hypothetical protein GY906_20680 [bacterium]|nr:hypothetical protein [bacterium]
MNRQPHTDLPQQTRLALGNDAQWEQLPRDVRYRCRELVVQLLMEQARSRAAGDSDER